MSQTPSFCPEGEEVKKMEVNTNTKKRGPYLPRELRIKIYNDVIALRQQGRSYNEIRMIIRQKYGVWISKTIISQWVRGLHSPYNGRRIPSLELLEPSEDLAYIIGMRLGDGYTCKERHRYSYIGFIALRAKDREFVEEAALRVASTLNIPPPKIYFDAKSGKYYFKVRSQTLYELLKKPYNFELLRKYIEHCPKCIAACLRGLFDSEGTVTKYGEIRLTNSDYTLLEYVRSLLKIFNIETTEPKLVHQQRSIICIKGRQCIRRRDVYHICVPPKFSINFYYHIGFTIRRKQKRLEEYLRRTGKI
jgi:intein-encoded DNA endonuclease-like protein